MLVNGRAQPAAHAGLWRLALVACAVLLPRLLYVPPIARRIWLALKDLQLLLKASADVRFSAEINKPTVR